MTLVGSSNELEVHVQGVLTRALIDTGSSVSTLSRSFYDTYLHDIPLQPVECLLTLECADGTELPYHGVISCELQVDGIADSPQTIQCLFLIVNDTKYHESVPVLIGTNILSVLLSEVWCSIFTKSQSTYTLVYCISLHDAAREGIVSACICIGSCEIS